MQIIIHSVDREDIPSLFKITSLDSLMYHALYIERLVRSSEEYKFWRLYNKEHEEAYIDYLEELDTREFKKISIELHHHPKTLFEIVTLVGKKTLDILEETDAFEIAKSVLDEHLLGHIGYVPMTITAHQKFHEGLIEIDDKDIKGNYIEFERKYLAC